MTSSSSLPSSPSSSSSWIQDTTNYVRDSLAQLVTDPPQLTYNADTIPRDWSTIGRNLFRSLLCPWTKQIDAEHPQPRLTRALSWSLVGLFGLSSFIAVREKLLRKTEKSITGQVVLITGGASGIGKLIAERLALRDTCQVIIWDVNRELLDATVLEIQQRGGFISGFVVDVTNVDEVKKCAHQIQQDIGDVDILINNAGIVHGKNVLECDERMMQKTVDVNLTSHFWTVRAFLPSMVRRNRGHIVCVSSATALVGIPGMADYSASKYGAFGFMEALRLEMKQSTPGVQTTIVCPYFINTGMFDGVVTKFPRLLPILLPDYVADKIIQGIKRGEELMVLPRFTYSVYFFRLFCPLWLQDKAADFFGLTHSMKSFQGKKPEERLANIQRVLSTKPQPNGNGFE